MAAVIESFFTAFVKTEAGADENPFNETEELTPEERNTQNDDEYSMGPGQVNFMQPGEDIVFANPTRPANGFDTFVKSVCSQIGAALEIPKDLLLKEFNASYSASRAALLEAWKAFKMRRELLIDKFCTPVYAQWFSEAVARGRINAPGFFEDPIRRAAYLGVEWVGPSQGQLDPIKEVNAEAAMIKEGFSTHEQSTARLTGGDWTKNIEQMKKENALLGGLGEPDPHQDKGGEESAS
jgi:lambda family phage portal protein